MCFNKLKICQPINVFQQAKNLSTHKCVSTSSQENSFLFPQGGGENWVGVCGPLPKTLTLFMTKICDIPYPIYDLTFKSKPSSDQW